ncbi:MAG TPA: hypothetical protein VFP89_15060 [Propionibacteriaceae bacterium]|nr:hypothetical protein [Propionibacteriaceae bacterium]
MPRPARWSRALRQHWQGLDLDQAAGLVADAAGLAGRLLPYTRIDGRPVFPLVTVDREVVVRRIGRRQGPILDRTLLRDFATTGFADAPPEAVVLSGFVVVEPFVVARRHLVGLRTWAPTVLAVPSRRPLRSFETAECDYHDHQVYLTDGREASALQSGAVRHEPAQRRADAWRRLRDEQMFQLALESGLLPC